MSVQGKKAKDRSNFPTAMSRFCLFFGFVVFWLVFFFSKMQVVLIPPQISKPLRSLLRLRASLRWRGSLLLSLSLTLSVSLADSLPHRLHRTGPLSACDVTHTHKPTR